MRYIFVTYSCLSFLIYVKYVSGCWCNGDLEHISIASSSLFPYGWKNKGEKKNEIEKDNLDGRKIYPGNYNNSLSTLE